MKIGAKLSFFNLTLRARRLALGYRTQKDLAQATGLPLCFIQRVEGLANIKASLRTIEDGLQRIAVALESELDELFPPDYRQVLEEAKLPKGHAGLGWQREVHLSTLPPSTSALLVPSAEETFLENQEAVGLPGAIAALLEALPQDERQVVALRYGFGADKEGMTLAETARVLGLTRDKVRGIELEALRRLRNSARTKLFNL